MSDQSSKVTKRRASRACNNCRARKVRCDVVNDGPPCNNCRLDGIQCIVINTSRRGRRAPTVTHAKPVSFSLPSVSTQSEEVQNACAVVPQFALFDNTDGLETISPPQTTGSRGSSINSMNLITSEEAATHNASFLGAERPTNHDGPIQLESATSPAIETSGAIFMDSRISALPFIEPARSNLAPEDLEYLHQKGAFIIPEPSLRNDLLRCYAQFVHPYLPAIDLEEFLEAVHGNERTKTVSLLLFQAVMFAATSFVAASRLVVHGCSSRRLVRNTFYERVKLLCDIDYETDRMVIIQCTLLMTYYNETPDSVKDSWYWVAVAVSHAQSLGLTQDQSESSSLTARQQRLWKRMWWSCYMRDRLAAISLRRSARIGDDTFDVPMLELSDFEPGQLPKELDWLSKMYPTCGDPTMRHRLASLCIALVQLCQCIGPVVDMQHDEHGPSFHGNGLSPSSLPEQALRADYSDILRCDTDLRQWHTRYAHLLECSGTVSTDSRTTGLLCEVLDTYRTIIKGLYYTMIITLHRPQIYSRGSQPTLDSQLKDHSYSRVHQAAAEIVEIYKHLLHRDLIKHLPNTGVTCVVAAGVFYLHELQASSPKQKDEATCNLGFCIKILQQLGEMYASAAFALHYFKLSKMKILEHIRRRDYGLNLAKKAPVDIDSVSAQNDSIHPQTYQPPNIDSTCSVIDPISGNEIGAALPPSAEELHSNPSHDSISLTQDGTSDLSLINFDFFLNEGTPMEMSNMANRLGLDFHIPFSSSFSPEEMDSEREI